MLIVMLGQKGLPARSGGIERHVSFLSSGLVERGHRVVVYARPWYVKGGLPMTNGVEQRVTRGIHTKHLDAITHGVTALWDARRMRPDVIHVHGAGTALLLPLARWLHPQAKLVTTFHCIDWEHAKWGVIARFAFKLGERIMCRWSDRVLSVSEGLMKYCLQKYQAQTDLIKHPFRAQSMPAETDRVLAGFGLQPERYLLSVSRLVEHKQPHVLIAAYAEAVRRAPEAFLQMPLVIVGGGSWTDDYVARLRVLGRTVPQVYFLGEQTGSSLAVLQAKALAHVFPTRSEGSAFTALEAGVYARPVIMTDIAANREVSGGSAVFVPLGDQEALVEALIKMARATEQERVGLGAGFLRHVRARHGYAERIDEVLRVYREVREGESTLVSPLPLARYFLRA